jgi:hypothetical protein
MRTAGQKINMDPRTMPVTTARVAGSITAKNPGLIETITANIVPGAKVIQVPAP